MIKKLFCKHNYKLFSYPKNDPRIRPHYTFVCTKCGKEYYVTTSNIIEYLIDAERLYEKSTFLNKEDQTLTEKTLYVQKYMFTEAFIGKYVDIVIRNYLKDGINIEEINNKRRCTEKEARERLREFKNNESN